MVGHPLVQRQLSMLCAARRSPCERHRGGHLNELDVALPEHLHPHRRPLDPNPLYSNRARVDSTTSS